MVKPQSVEIVLLIACTAQSLNQPQTCTALVESGESHTNLLQTQSQSFENYVYQQFNGSIRLILKLLCIQLPLLAEIVQFVHFYILHQFICFQVLSKSASYISRYCFTNLAIYFTQFISQKWMI